MKKGRLAARRPWRFGKTKSHRPPSEGAPPQTALGRGAHGGQITTPTRRRQGRLLL